jgi:hypothetical protein
MEEREKVEDKAVTPLVDMDKLGALFEERMQAGLKVFAQEQQQAQQQREQEAQQAEQQRAAQEVAQKDAFRQVLDPYLQPVAQGLKFQADDTKDYVQFYTEHPVDATRRQAIEQKFNELAKAGRAIPREDIHTWFVGRDQLAKDREAAAQTALQASTINAGVGSRGATEPKDPYSMSKEEMIEFLGRTPF